MLLRMMKVIINARARACRLMKLNRVSDASQRGRSRDHHE
jgi:hypothetical protein